VNLAASGYISFRAAVNPVNKAIWFIESHFAEEMSLDQIAAVAGVSRFHLSRAFGLATGYSVMEYVRARRLTEAAGALAAGAPDILAVALDSAYASHEAFTRAFRDQFGLTPEKVREQGHLNNITLKEPFKMNDNLLVNLDPPRFEDGRTLLIAGLSERYSESTNAGIPALWQRFVPHLGHVPGQIGHVAYGVVYNGDGAGNIDYMAGVEVSSFSALPPEFSRLQIPEQKYAIFTHRGHISDIRRTWHTIFNLWLPQSGRKLAHAPEIERYSEDFDGRTGLGTVEIWIPLSS
jgi:AraC family transcriptional regulator